MPHPSDPSSPLARPGMHSERPPACPPEPSEAQIVPPAPRQRPHGFRRAVGLIASLVGTAITFVAALGGGTVLHVGVAPARRIATVAVNEILSSTFRGKITITRLGRLRPYQVDGVNATLSTHDGAPILLAEGVHARLALGPLLWSLVKGGDLALDVTEVSIDHVDALLAAAPDGNLTVAEAFQPAVEGPPAPPKSSSSGLDLGLPKIAIRTAWVHGAIGGTPIDATVRPLTASFSMTPKNMAAKAAFGAEVRALTQGAPIALDVSAGLGSSVIDAHVLAATGKSTVDVTAHARIPSADDPTTAANVKVVARDVDARAFGGPASSVGMDTEADATIAADGAVSGKYEVHVLPGDVSAQATPDARIGGTFTDKRVLGAAHVSETGAPIDLRYDVALAAVGGPDVAFDLTTRSHDLTKVAQLGGAIKSTALVEAKGHALLGSKQIDAHVVTQLDNFSAGSITFNHATADAAVRGSLLSPQAALLLNVSDLRLGSLMFPAVTASAYGSPKALRIDAKLDGQGGRHVTVGANVAATDGVRVRDVTATLTRAKDAITATVASVDSRDGRLDVEGLKLEGAGAPLTGDVHMRPGALTARLQSTGIDLGTIARFIEGDQSKRGGHVALDVDLTASKSATRGHANLDATGVTDGHYVQAVNAKLTATFEGKTVDAKLDASDAKVGRVQLSTEGATLGGGLLDPVAFERATGKAHVEVDVDLAKATAASPIDLPIQEASGRLVAKIDAQRDEPRDRPSIAVDVATDKLTFSTLPTTVPNDDGSLTVIQKPFHSQDLDAHVTASVEGRTGKTRVAAELHDKVGPLFKASADATLPVNDIFAGNAQEALLATAVTFHADVPMRSLDSLPPMLGTLPIRGKVGVTLDAKGDVRSPEITGELEAEQIVDSDDPTPIPINFGTKFSYDGKRVIVTLAGTRPEGKVLEGSAVMSLAVADLLGGTSPLPWDASANIKLHEMPIGAVADFANQEIDGNVSGDISIRDLHKAGAMNVKLALDNLVLSGAKFPSATASLDMANGTMTANARIEQKDGFADVTAGGGMKWGDAVAPTPDETKPVQLKLSAKNFRLVAFAPFLAGTLDKLDGILDANATLSVKPGFNDGALEGKIALDKVDVESPVVGEEFHDLKAQVTMSPWGNWKLEQLEGKATSGKFTASAQAKMNGFHLASAEAHLNIREREKIPLTMQGTALGQAWGNVDVKGAMSPDGKKLDVDVNVPNFHVDLEDATEHSVESTDPDPTLTVGMYDKHGRMERLAYDGTQPIKLPAPKAPPPNAPPPLAIHVTTHLGPDLEIRRGSMLRLYVTQGPTIDIGTATKISGGIRIAQGYIELQGKRFQVEDSTVLFTGQPVDNPLIHAEAVYQAPDADQTKVIARFIGPVKTGKVTLDSEPKLTDSEILSVLMFGSSDGTFGQSAPAGEQGNETTEAASVAGGVVTQGLNKAISGVTGGLEVQTSVDTEQTGNPRPEVEVALSRRITAKVLYSLGIPPPGDNPDDTLLLVDWRLKGHFSTETTLGDKGTTIVDLAWKYRY